MKDNTNGIDGTNILDNGPFYHGTKADLKLGDCSQQASTRITTPKLS